MADDLPTVPVLLTVHPRLRILAEDADLRGMLASELDGLLDDFGVPGRAEARVRAGDDPDAERWAAVHVHGAPCGLPAAAADRVRELLDPGRAGVPVVDWLEGLLAGGSPGDHERARRFCTLAVRAVLLGHLPDLVGDAQAEVYTAQLPAAARSAAVGAVVRTVLAAKVSVGDTATVARVLDAGDEGAVEELLAALRPEQVTVGLRPAYLRELTEHAGTAADGLLAFLRQGLLDELGLLVPPIVLRPDDTLPPQSVTVTVNHANGVPVPGLAAGEVLVNEVAQRLGPDFTVLRQMTNPATDVPNVVVPAAEGPRAAARGLTVWDARGFLELAVAAVLRDDAACLVDRRSVGERLEVVATVHPGLIRQIRALVGTDDVVHVVRALLREGVPVRNLPAVLERMLEAQPAQDSVPLVEFVRAGLAHAIAARFAGRFRTLVAYLLDAGTEAAVRAHPESEETRGRLLAALRAEVGSLPTGVKVPGLVTGSEVRMHVRRIVAGEFPRMPVLAYEELPADLDVQPIARLSPAGSPTGRPAAAAR